MILHLKTCVYASQAYPDEKKSALEAEFKKLVNEWPVDVVKHQKEEDKKVKIVS